MSIQTNQAIARRYLADFWNLGDTSAISEIVAVDAVGHVAGERITAGPKMLLARRASLLGIYTNPTFTLEDEIAAGDKVVLRWTFRGKHTGINIFRIVDGKIAELWVESDDLGEQRQLGVIPAGN